MRCVSEDENLYRSELYCGTVERQGNSRLKHGRFPWELLRERHKEEVTSTKTLIRRSDHRLQWFAAHRQEGREKGIGERRDSNPRPPA